MRGQSVFAILMDRILPAAVLAVLFVAQCTSAQSSLPKAGTGHIVAVTAITEVFGDGQKLTAAAVEYDQKIANGKLSSTAFTVPGRTITRVYANNSAGKSAQGADGRFVILELAADDPGAATYWQELPPPGQDAPPPPGGPRKFINRSVRKPAKVSVLQSGAIATASGKTCPAAATAVDSSKVVNLVVDEFVQRSFTDPDSGEALPYNLFIPRNYDTSKSYPLIIFIHDAGVLSTQTDSTLLQGMGAVIWATPAEQGKHPAFVLAPQFNRTAASGSLTDLTVHLIQAVAAQYGVDRKRIYTTGQSLGCTLSMEMLLNYPDLFAAAMLVAGQIEDTPRTAGLARQKLWITVSEGDALAFPTMNKSLPIMAAAGATIATGRWNAQLPDPELLARDKTMLDQQTNILYTTFEKGTTFPPGQEYQGGTEHMGTWKFAYRNEGIRDWLFRQSR